MSQRILIDSHVLIFLLYEPKKISPESRILLDAADEVAISQASLWELTLKHTKGKLIYRPEDFMNGVDVLGVDRVQLTDEILLKLKFVKLEHADPFDAIIAATALAHGYTLMTSDSLLLKSKIPTTKA
jgi:PIN domain nuclease of toxin-antitoxin system